MRVVVLTPFPRVLWCAVHSETVRRAVSSRELRSIITSIDTAPNRELALQHHLTANADLAQFVNELLIAMHGAEHYRSTYTDGGDQQLPEPLSADATPAQAANALLTTLAVAQQQNLRLT